MTTVQENMDDSDWSRLGPDGKSRAPTPCAPPLPPPPTPAPESVTECKPSDLDDDLRRFQLRPNTADCDVIRSNIVLAVIEMTGQPTFSFKFIQERLMVLKQVLLLFKDTNLSALEKSEATVKILTRLAPPDAARWIREEASETALFMLDLNPDMFQAGKLQRIWWASQSKRDHDD